ncbi:MAG: serine/threonine-protein kinase, partial [Candidatus Thermoplasmatota archaeon]|nr:serine/threonine-protein kinase [Candidatus Thermoplasmatota archaeon]
MSANPALFLFVFAVLLLSAVTLLVIGRPRRHTLYMVAFLTAVALNFGLHGWRMASDVPLLDELAFAALAVDPLLLLAFVTLYPFDTRTRSQEVLLAVSGLIALAVVGGLLIAPLFATHPLAAGFGELPWREVAGAHVLVGYATAWFLALRAATRAPTDLLAQQSGWLVRALGVAIVPRLGLAHTDFGLRGWEPSSLIAPGSLWSILQPAVSELLYSGVVLAGVLVASKLLVDRWTGGEPRAEIVRALRFTAWVLVAFVGVQVLSAITSSLGGPQIIWTIPLSLRWFGFAGILVYGILAYQVVSFDRSVDAIFGTLGGIAMGVGVALFALVVQFEAGLPQDIIPAVALGLATSAPATLLCRELVRGVQAKEDTPRPQVRQYELFRASLEAAWASGRPSGTVRERLERERKAFGLSHQEARILEHVVAADLAPDGSNLQEGEEPLPGVVIERVIAEGTQGTVYRARRFPEQDTVVVKSMRWEADSQIARRRLADEVRALQQLSHPHIVDLLDIHILPGRYLLVMEAIEGGSLADRLDRGRVKPPEAIRWTLEALDALEAAHAEGILHRDIKPSNVMIESDRAVLMDFGIVKIASAMTALTGSGQMVGTLDYISPEQVQG